MERLDQLVTEQRSRYETLDTKGTREILEVLNREDQGVPLAVGREIPRIEAAVALIAAAFRRGNRLFYVGAGTSGRLGVLDASECPPTFGVEPDMVQGIIAGGDAALRRPTEDTEDRPGEGRKDLESRGVRQGDVVVGIAASGRTPYVIGALEAAAAARAHTVALVCNPDTPMSRIADVTIAPVVGPEVLLGSTRMKAGTAQKLVLNMLTTTSMILIGKVYSNLMVDVQASNVKLAARAKRIVQAATGCSAAQAETVFEAAGGRPKTAIVMLLAGCDRARADALLDGAQGFVRNALESAGMG